MVLTLSLASKCFESLPCIPSCSTRKPECRWQCCMNKWWDGWCSITLSGLRDFQIAGKTLFHFGCVWKRLAFESVDWVKKLHLHQGKRASSSLVRAWLEQKHRENGNFLSPWAGMLSVCSCPQTLEVLALRALDTRTYSSAYSPGPSIRPSNSNWITPPAFLVFQFVHDRSWYFLTSIIT